MKKEYVFGFLLFLPLFVYMVWYSVQVDKQMFTELKDCYGAVDIDKAIESGGIRIDR